MNESLDRAVGSVIITKTSGLVAAEKRPAACYERRELLFRSDFTTLNIDDLGNVPFDGSLPPKD